MQITYTKEFIKQFEKYDKKLQQQIITAIENLPLGDVVILKGNHTPKLYRLRVRSYRVIFDMNEHEITVLLVDSRGGAYKGL